MKTKEQLVDHLIDVISECDCSSEESLRQALAEEGYDYDTLCDEGCRLIENIKRENKIC